MPRNSSGVYSLPLPPVIPDTVIESVWANTTLDDVAQSLTDSLDRYGRGSMVGPFRFADGSLVAPGCSWTAETSSGFARLGTGVMAAVILGAEAAEFNVGGMTVPAGKKLVLTDVPAVGPDAANKTYVDGGDSTTLFNANEYTDNAVANAAGLLPGLTAINPVDITASRALTAADFGTGIIRINAGAAIAITVPTLAVMGLPLATGLVRIIAFQIEGAGIPTFAGATGATSINGTAGPTLVPPISGAPVRYQYVVLSQAASGSNSWLLN
jgi:hypothetical protein